LVEQLASLGFAKTSCVERELLLVVKSEREGGPDIPRNLSRATGGCVNEHPIGFTLGKDDAVE